MKFLKKTHKLPSMWCFFTYECDSTNPWPYIFWNNDNGGGQAYSWKKKMCQLSVTLISEKKTQLTQAYSLLWLYFSWFSLWLIDSVALGEEIHHDRSMEWTELIISWPRAERDEEEVAEALWPSLRACSLWTEAISWGSTSWNFHFIQ